MGVSSSSHVHHDGLSGSAFREAEVGTMDVFLHVTVFPRITYVSDGVGTMILCIHGGSLTSRKVRIEGGGAGTCFRVSAFSS
jgi:hypothetical protein